VILEQQVFGEGAVERKIIALQQRDIICIIGVRILRPAPDRKRGGMLCASFQPAL
jgi:hypothetical protein